MSNREPLFWNRAPWRYEKETGTILDASGDTVLETAPDGHPYVEPDVGEAIVLAVNLHLGGNMKKPILCLDFDGVCHSYTSGWKGAAVIPDPPVAGMWEFLDAALALFEVNIFSSRTHQENGKQAMYEWFMTWAKTANDRRVAIELVFPTEKPSALVGLDDRVLLFDGSWPDVQALITFKPWNKQKV